ncbi:hypothetical protein QTN25_008031 [Entamoeba marina]
MNVLNRFHVEKKRYLEDIGNLNDFEFPNPPNIVVDWVNQITNQPQKLVQQSRLSSIINTNDDIVSESKSTTNKNYTNQSSDKKNNTTNDFHKVTGEMSLEIGDINLQFQEPIKKKKEIDESTCGESTLLFMNNQYHTRSVGVTADLAILNAPIKRKRKFVKSVSDESDQEQKPKEEYTSMKKGTLLEQKIIAPQFPTTSTYNADNKYIKKSFTDF